MNISSFLIGYQAGKNAGGGGSSADVRYVTFMSYDGTEEHGRIPVAVGYDCPNPKFAVTRESDAQHDYVLAGWATAPNGALNSDALKAITEDRTVYANFASVLRSYTITFCDEDGTVLNSKKWAYGSVPSYTAAKDGYVLDGWTPEVVAVTGEASYTAIWKPKPAFATTQWSDIVAVSASGKASTTFSLGDKRNETINGTEYELEIAGFDHDDLADGSGKAGITVMFRTVVETTASFSDGTDFGSSSVRQWLNNDFKSLLPSDLQESIKTVNKSSPTTATGALATLAEQVWVASLEEMCGVIYSVGGTSVVNAYKRPQGTQYALYDSNSKRIRYQGETAVRGITRTIRGDHGNLFNFAIDNTGAVMNGSLNASGTANKNIIVGFCI